MSLTDEQIAEIEARLEELAVEAEQGRASTDYYLEGMMPAPDPAVFREAVAALREARAELERVRGLFSEGDAALLDEIARDAVDGRASTDYYLEGMMPAPEPDPIVALAARIRQVTRGETT